MHQKNNDYYLGLIYCVRNDIDNAYFYLGRAAKKGNKKADLPFGKLSVSNLFNMSIKDILSG